VCLQTISAAAAQVSNSTAVSHRQPRCGDRHRLSTSAE